MVRKPTLILSIILFLISAFATRAVLRQHWAPFAPQPPVVACPLNGKLYPAKDEQSWIQHRPLVVMMDNHPQSRPQSGISSADVVFEAQIENGATFYMPIFYCNISENDIPIAPIRSARIYFVDWATGFHNPLYAHLGGANTPGPADALSAINNLGWTMKNDLNQFSIGVQAFDRNYNRIPGRVVPTEYTMQSTTNKLLAVAAQRGQQTASGSARPWQTIYQGWEYQPVSHIGFPTVKTINFDFWEEIKGFNVKWEYDKKTQGYIRSVANQRDSDFNSGDQIEASNVVLLFTQLDGPIDAEKHMLYTTTGTGKALIYNRNGTTIATWSKPQPDSELKFIDSKGNPVLMERGFTWITALGNDVKVTATPFTFFEKVSVILSSLKHYLLRLIRW